MNRYCDWLFKVLCWDGLLPLGVLLTPNLVKMLLPGGPGALELTFVLVPIAAFLLRAWEGRRRYLLGEIYLSQAIVVAVAILILVFLDAMLIMMNLVNNQPPNEAFWLWGGLYCVYLVLMALAFFPARVPYAISQVSD